LSLERNISLASAAVFILGLGEELWKKFLPKYLEALGATTFIVGLYGTAEDFFDAIYQYPGGWLADHLGRRRAFLIFVALASLGYVVYLFSPSWPFIFVGLAFVMAWQSMASPAIFALIGDALPRERRAMGFTLAINTEARADCDCPDRGRRFDDLVWSSEREFTLRS
jgi:MFS family permease